MPRFRFHLHDGRDTPPLTEMVDAVDDLQAAELARIRLLLTCDYTHAQVYRGGRRVAEFKRDSYPG